MAAARPVVLVRYRPGVVGETARTVHVVPLPTNDQANTVSAVCGAALRLEDLETVNPGEGMPCTGCLLTHVMSTTPAAQEPPASSPDPADGGLAAGEIAYQQWGWPVSVHRDQVRLSLHREASALALPTPLGTEVTQILLQRRCAQAVVTNPYMPEHHIVLTGERYGVGLSWPPQVHQVTGVLLLPPTVTPRGPITWIRAPQQDSLQLCREIDLVGALRTALNDGPATWR